MKLDSLKHYLLGWGPTWSQFGEDAHLRSYFRDKGWVRGRGHMAMEKGFYVDIGCCHPIRMSNTLWFYKNGWTGINIDATPGTKIIFDKWRPRDINLEAAVSMHSGHLTFYTDGGKSSVYNTTSAEQAKKLVGTGAIRNLMEIHVKALRLYEILDRHLPPGRSISFFSVDAEGSDLEVLQSNDWSRYRPELILVEAHTETFENLTHSELIGFMNQQGYSVRAWVRPNLVLERND